MMSPSTTSVLLAALALAPSALAADVRVRAGSSIQAAIDAAAPGTRIVVDAGTYAEQLVINKTLELKGKDGAKIVPPNPSVTNPCTRLAGDDPFTGTITQAGICIFGSGVNFDGFKGEGFGQEHRIVTNVTTPVKDVKVEGFDISGFVGLNIAVVGAKNAEIRGNVLTDGARYGVLTLGSTGTHVVRNTIKSSDLKFIGVCMDDFSDVKSTQNQISDYGIALCVQTNGAEVSHNKVRNCCFGVLADPGVSGPLIKHNQINGSNPFCNPFFGGVSAGIVLDGVVNAEVRHNTITGIFDGGNENYTASAITIADRLDKGIVANGNQITHNTLSGNENDIWVLTNGTNEIRHNKCTLPAALCAAQ